MRQLSDVTAFLRRLAPLALAEEWDNVGLLLGDEQAAVHSVMTCLTLTSDVAGEAVEEAASLVVTHHPILFRPVQRLTRDTREGSLILDLVAAGIAVYAPHTSYDSAQQGINQQLAECLGLQDVRVLRRQAMPERCKLVTFVPQSQLERVQTALWDAGAGRIGEYSNCSYYHPGTGTFLGSDASNPATGRAGQFERVEELRLEVVCSKTAIPAVVDALRSAHAYEEPAYDIYPLVSEPGVSGAGRFGMLPEPLSLGEFNTRVKSRLGATALQFVGDESRTIHRVAIACGSAAEFIRDACQFDCDVLLTGEARFHACLEAKEQGIALVLPGHYATERPAMETLAGMLRDEFSDLTIWASRSEQDPLSWA